MVVPVIEIVALQVNELKRLDVLEPDFTLPAVVGFEGPGLRFSVPQVELLAHDWRFLLVVVVMMVVLFFLGLLLFPIRCGRCANELIKVRSYCQVAVLNDEPLEPRRVVDAVAQHVIRTCAHSEAD